MAVELRETLKDSLRLTHFTLFPLYYVVSEFIGSADDQRFGGKDGNPNSLWKYGPFIDGNKRPRFITFSCWHLPMRGDFMVISLYWNLTAHHSYYIISQFSPNSFTHSEVNKRSKLVRHLQHFTFDLKEFRRLKLL